MELTTISLTDMTLEQLEQELLQLPREVRSRLADVLTESVEREVAAVWDAEADRRYQAYLRGEIQAYPAKEALAELKAKLFL